MDQFLATLGAALRLAIMKSSAPIGQERPDTKKIYKAIESTETLVAARFGGPVFHRYRGRSPNVKPSYSNKPQRAREYLWDFSFSRFAIPQAIGKSNATKITQGKYELLLVAESELGTSDEACRDLLKLLDARCLVRCLIYKQPKQATGCDELHRRMLQVMHNHAHFRPEKEAWLLVGLTWKPGALTCDVRTLNPGATAVVPVAVR